MRYRAILLQLTISLLIGLSLISVATRAAALSVGAEPFSFLYDWSPGFGIEDARLVDRFFASRAALTWIHILSGSVFLLLAPWQFVSRIRQRDVRLHRWNGRIVLLVAMPAGISGFALQVASPFGGLTALSAIVAAGTLFLGSGLRAYLAIRARDIATHREWMTRMLAVALGVGTVRLIALPLVLVTGQRPLDLMGIAFWLGFTIPVVTNEWWIRSARLTRDSAVPRLHTPA